MNTKLLDLLLDEIKECFPFYKNSTPLEIALHIKNAIMNLQTDLATEKKLHEKTEIHCEIREKALYDIRKLVEPGSEISKIAGKALCYGCYKGYKNET